MTQAAGDITSPPPAAPAELAELRSDAVPTSRARLWTPIVTHTGVDYLSFVMVALMPLLASRIGFDNNKKALLLGLGPIASGLIQPVVAWLGDKFDSRIFGPLGMVTAGLAVGSLGFINSFGVLAVVYFIATMGVGAFHPPAAAAVGQSAGRRRSIMLSVFFSAGMLGGVLGNICSPMWVNFFASRSGEAGTAATTAGLRSLALLIIPACIGAAVLGWATLGRSHHHHDAHARHASMSAIDRRRRWIAFYTLYAGNVIRFPVNMALVYLFMTWAEEITAARQIGTAEQIGLLASGLNGPLQAAMQIGMGGGGILLGLLLRPRIEKPAFVLLPILGAIPIVIFPYANELPGFAAYAAAFGMSVLAGVGFGGMFPVSLSLGQRLLPHRTAFASGMLLGGAWCFGVFGSLGAQRLHEAIGLHRAFIVVACLLACSGLLMLTLPGKLLRAIDPH